MEESSSIELDGRVDCIECVKLLVSLSRQKVNIICENLAPVLYNHTEIFDHLSGLATTNQKTEVRIIAHDTRPAGQDGHLLIQLAQKLPSFVKIRTTVLPSHRKFSENWLIVDDESYMRIRHPQRFEGYYEIDNKLDCREYLDQFNEIWEASEVDQNTRRLNI